MDRSPLPRAPQDALGPAGPRLGAYQGSLGRVDLGALAPPGLLASVRHAARQRRWQRVLLCAEGHLLALAVQEGGPLSGATVWVIDRGTGEVIFDRAAAGLPGLNAHIGPHPGAGARSGFTGPGVSVSLERRSDRYQLEAALADALALSVRLDARGAPEPFALVAPLPEEGLRVAQLSGPLPAEGRLKVRGQSVDLAGALAVLDFGAGLFPRQAAWRTLTAAGRLPDGRAVALRLAEGLGGPAPGDGGEDVLLAAGGPWRLPPVVFEAGAGSATAPWRATSAGGEVALTFQPAASHREGRELLLVSAQATQLLGTLSGQVPGPDGATLEVPGLPALLEDLAARG